MLQYTDVIRFLDLTESCPILDVRSPSEYAHAHIPGASSFPIFSDEERKVIGTTYKQIGREQAIKEGLDFFGTKMRRLVEEAERIVATHAVGQGNKQVLVHCWRGGMRSAAMAWLLDLYGFKVTVLTGGYKAFRNWALAQCDAPVALRVLGGYTGSGKTDLLHHMADQGCAVLDLEALANHKGSAFGGDPKLQPTQEMFDNLLAMALRRLQLDMPGQAVWVEDESRRIGDINLPLHFFGRLRVSQVYFLEVPFDARLDHIVADYAGMPNAELAACTLRISKRLGGLATKETLAYLEAGNRRLAFAILLKYYDKYYGKGIAERQEGAVGVTGVPCVVAGASNFDALMQVAGT